MAQSADRGGRGKRHRDDEEDEGVNLHGKRRAVGSRRSDSASTWRKRQGGGEASMDMGSSGVADHTEIRKESSRPPPPLNEDEGVPPMTDVMNSWSDISAYGHPRFVPPQLQVPPQQQQSPPARQQLAAAPQRIYGPPSMGVQQPSSRDPSPMNREFPPTFVQSSMHPARMGATEFYATAPMQQGGRPPASRQQPQVIDDSARVLHPSKSAVMNAIATIGLPFLQYELSATEARFPPAEEGHLFAALALHVSMRNAARRAQARDAPASEKSLSSKIAGGEDQSNMTREHHLDQGKGIANLRRLALKKKPLSVRRGQLLGLLVGRGNAEPAHEQSLISYCSLAPRPVKDLPPASI